MTDSYLILVDHSGLRAMFVECRQGIAVLHSLLRRLPNSAPFWAILDSDIAAVLCELVEAEETSLALDLLTKRAKSAGPLLDANPRLALDIQPN